MASSKIRMGGLISGLDTDSIISAMVSNRKTAVDNKKNDQTKLQWKQDIWKDLNKDLKSLQSAANNLRFSSAYSKKTTKVSDSSKVSVITGDGTPDSVQNLKIKKLAKSGYLTGGKVTTESGEGATALSKLSDLGFSGEASTISLTTNGKTTDIEIDGNTTISNLLTKIKGAGLNASFDADNQRFFISSKTTGEKADFSIAAGDDNGKDALRALGLDSSSAIKINGQDAEIELNNATFTSSSNVFKVNGLTITANDVTEGEGITLTTTQDTSGIYDMIKKFMTTYNTIINKLDKFYNADSAKGYNPLTDEEKEAMSESEVEKYEQKIKDSLLKNDGTVSTITSALTSIMSAGYDIGGKTMYLSNFGISTLNYFNSAEGEKHAYHIDGNSDDEETAGNADKLREAIASDPNSVISLFSKLSQQLYTKMNDMSKSVNGYRSYGSFFNDKKMKSEYTDYTSKIAEMEEKLNAYEDKLYARYSKMETTLAKLQSNTSAITGFMGN